MSELVFRQPVISDAEKARAALSHSGYRGCECTFGNNFSWRGVYDIGVCFFGEFYFCRFGKGDNVRFTAPSGGDVIEGVSLLREYCESIGIPLRILADRERAELICGEFPEAAAEYDRDSSDYVYLAEDLALLRGKKFHAKRNHLNRFYENDWSFEPLTPANIGEVEQMNLLWEREAIPPDDPLAAEKHAEECAVREALKNFAALRFRGGVLRVNGEVQGFCFGEPSASGDCFVVHAEKALRRYQGAYAAINCEFVKSLGGEYRYINREEDTGAENLRKAKLSYNPVFLVDKFNVFFGGQS